ncbi:Aldo/keto reductase [Gymnopilus junonius]|uniref:Aldo/keto reductase n=1 Tax=Gymnopilus junonius TaxID=109634 RepID=A0A9P5TLL6_GYMJU|nr:Aldo/keto reductase [Gymnopilus junonius]
MSFFPQPAPPPTKLARYRQLAPRAAIHVSPLQLGAMSIGDRWTPFGFAEMNKESSFKLLDAFFEAGGNFIDTANTYQDGASEEYIGNGWRHEGTYTSTPFRANENKVNQANFVGNNLKSLKLSLEVSLKRLRTTYIDVLYVHFPDNHTSSEEIMDGLHALVQQGTVLYLVRPWDFQRPLLGLRFVIYQAPYSVLQRDLEREIIPMCQHEGIALAFWNVLAAGKIRSDEEENRRRESRENGRAGFGPTWERNETEKKMCAVLEKIAAEVGTKHVTAVAIAYTLHKAPIVFPIVGGRKVEQLHANIEALNIRLTPEQINAIETAVPFEAGAPYNALGPIDQYSLFVNAFAHFDPQPRLPPILPEDS